MKNKNKHGNSQDFLSKCPFCGDGFEAEDVTVLGEKEQKTTLHATCINCQTSAIFLLSTNQAGIVSLGVATDLDKEEVRDKFLCNAISADEVIDAHQFVLRGDVMQLLK